MQLLDIFIPIRGVTGQNPATKKRFYTNFDINAKHYIYKPITKPIAVTLDFHFTGKCGVDIDNLLKSLFDALQHSDIIKNDNLIKKISVEIHECSMLEGITLKIIEYL